MSAAQKLDCQILSPQLPVTTHLVHDAKPYGMKFKVLDGDAADRKFKSILDRSLQDNASIHSQTITAGFSTPQKTTEKVLENPIKEVLEDKSRSEALIRYTIGNLKDIKDSVFSNMVYVRNLPWRIMIQPSVKQKRVPIQHFLGVFLHCNNKSESNSWACFAHAELRLLKANQSLPPFIKKIQHLFTPKKNYCGFYYFISLDDVLNVQNGFLKNDAITFEVHVIADDPWDNVLGPKKNPPISVGCGGGGETVNQENSTRDENKNVSEVVRKNSEEYKNLRSFEKSTVNVNYSMVSNDSTEVKCYGEVKSSGELKCPREIKSGNLVSSRRDSFKEAKKEESCKTVTFKDCVNSKAIEELFHISDAKLNETRGSMNVLNSSTDSKGEFIKESQGVPSTGILKTDVKKNRSIRSMTVDFGSMDKKLNTVENSDKGTMLTFDKGFNLDENKSFDVCVKRNLNLIQDKSFNSNLNKDVTINQSSNVLVDPDKSSNLIATIDRSSNLIENTNKVLTTRFINPEKPTSKILNKDPSNLLENISQPNLAISDHKDFKPLDDNKSENSTYNTNSENLEVTSNYSDVTGSEENLALSGKYSETARQAQLKMLLSEQNFLEVQKDELKCKLDELDNAKDNNMKTTVNILEQKISKLEKRLEDEEKKRLTQQAKNYKLEKRVKDLEGEVQNQCKKIEEKSKIWSEKRHGFEIKLSKLELDKQSLEQKVNILEVQAKENRNERSRSGRRNEDNSYYRKNEDVSGKTNDSYAGKTNECSGVEKTNEYRSVERTNEYRGVGYGGVEKTNEYGGVERTNETVLGRTNESVLGTTDESVLGKINESVLGKTNESVLGKTNESVLGKTNESVLGTTDESVLGTTNESVLGKTYESVLGKTYEGVSGKTNESVLGKTNESVMSKTNENSSTDKTIENSKTSGNTDTCKNERNSISKKINAFTTTTTTTTRIKGEETSTGKNLEQTSKNPERVCKKPDPITSITKKIETYDVSRKFDADRSPTRKSWYADNSSVNKKNPNRDNPGSRSPTRNVYSRDSGLGRSTSRQYELKDFNKKSEGRVSNFSGSVSLKINPGLNIPQNKSREKVKATGSPISTGNKSKSGTKIKKRMFSP